jgi:hypothetical protein
MCAVGRDVVRQREQPEDRRSRGARAVLVDRKDHDLDLAAELRAMWG